MAAATTAAPADFGAFVPDGMCRREATAQGVLDGLTFAVKDLIDVDGCRTGGGNPDWLAQQKPAARSAPVVEIALAAGATLIGKTVTDELAFSLEGRNVHHSRLVNPVCPGRLPGGSSSGSAVAVAGRLVDFALGTDTGGSVRVPANFLGLFGFRPSHGAISLDGVVPFAPSYDTVGWFARNAKTLAKVGDALLPAEERVTITQLKLADDAFGLVDPPLAAELKTKATRLGPTGSVSIFDGKEADYFECYRVLQGAEIWQSVGPWITNHKPRFADDIAQRFAGTAAITRSDVARYVPVRAAIQGTIEKLVPQDTAILMPITPCPALIENAPGDVIGSFYQRALTLTSVAGHCGAPQVALPLGRWQECPIGLAILGPRGSDRALLQLATTIAAQAAAMVPA
ncbi:MAG: amidase [Xanthobacteraceae bacterium]